MRSFGVVKLDQLIPHEAGVELYSKSLPGGQAIITWVGDCPINDPESVLDLTEPGTGHPLWYSAEEIETLTLVG